MSTTFYYHPFSTAAVTLWELTELGIPHEKVKVDLSEKRDQDRPEFRKLNPNGKVPVLVVDGTPIFESAAITLFLGEQYGVAKGLWPEAGVRRGLATQWVVWTNVSILDAFTAWWRNTSERTPAEQRNAAAAAVGKHEFERLLGILDAHLAGKQWLLGDQVTLADLHLASFTGYFKMCGADLAPYANLGAWLARAEARPSHDAYVAAAKA